ncbi:hypothetical protein N9954_00025 [Maribacter sp.]|nr:hypothetical protein [Maribacter sp.]
MSSPNYKDNPEHYKQLIAKINEGANFPIYLHQKGYVLIKQSAGSMEFQNDEDRIILQTSRSPFTYFNRNDSLDKGLFFKYLLQRSPNFYIAVQSGLEIISQKHEVETIDLKTEKPKRSAISLEENYNIVPLRNATYLRKDRQISNETVNNQLFKSRIFNAYHIRDNGGKIANIAFPKYDLENNPKNYVLYNKSYRGKADNKIKKFRLVLNKKDQFLFYSKPIDSPGRVIFGESGTDLLSYHELHGKPEDFYISFGGNVYKEKLQFFVQLIEPYLKAKTVDLVSIMDNDTSGHEFDLKVFTAVINHYSKNVYIESSVRRDIVSLHIHYTEGVRHRISKHKDLIQKGLTCLMKRDDPILGIVKCIVFSDKLLLEFPLKETIDAKHTEQKSSVFQTLLKTINALYLPFKTSMHKSQGKDWNDDLRESKKIKYLKMEKVVQNKLTVGDKIELNTIKGPEGATNQGIIKTINEKGVECDFGLHYTYAIPYSSITFHFKKITFENGVKENNRLEKNSKNVNLQTHTL